MTGIYKITSPSGAVYIGQSININKRITNYKCGYSIGPRLKNSVSKYGYDSHDFKIIHQLPKDVDRTIMDIYEKTYINLYISCGIDLMNLTDGGTGGRVFVGRKMSEETKLKIGLANKGRKPSEEAIKKAADLRRGKPIPEWHKVKLRASRSGKGHTDDSKKKMSDTIIAALAKKRADGWVRPPMTEATGLKISATKKGIATRPKDYRHSEETKMKIGNANRIRMKEYHSLKLQDES